MTRKKKLVELAKMLLEKEVVEGEELEQLLNSKKKNAAEKVEFKAK
jgi:ATP-dependent Zn protease